MPTRQLFLAGNRWRCWSGVLAVVALALLEACTARAPLADSRYQPPPAPRETTERPTHRPEEQAATGHNGTVFIKLPTGARPVQVEQAPFTSAMTALLLSMPLRVASATPVRPGGKLAPGTGGSGGEAWPSNLARSYASFCERRGSQGDCLSLFDDGQRFQADDKLKLALALAVGPALEGAASELRATFNPNQVLAAVTFGITAYMALWLVPDPVITKGMATASTVLLWAYLGSELFDVLRAYVRLSEESARAATFAELRDAGERFGHVIGPNSVRVLVMLATAAVGETTELVSRAPKLPGWEQASRAAELNTGLRLDSAASGASQLIVSTNEGTLRVVLPMTAMAMAARNDGSRTPKEGRPLPNGHRAFKSFADFKDFMGPAGKDKAWHHIVEQRKVNVERFGPEAIHNTENVIAVETATHDAISAYYSSKTRETGGMVVREWLRTKSYEEQRTFGLKVLRQFGVIP